MTLPALCAAPMMRSSSRSTLGDIGSTSAPLLSAIERSAGPRKSASMPGVAEIERAARGCEFADGNANHRRRAALAHLRDSRDQRGGVPESVLGVERDRGKAFAADELGDDRRGQSAPAAVDGLAGLEPAGQR